MSDFARLLHQLHRLNDLENSPPAPWAQALTPHERLCAIQAARRSIPGFLLAHHDSLLGQGRRSLVAVENGFCGACHLKIAHVHSPAHAAQSGLDVCDHCGAFLEWLPASSPIAVAFSSVEAPLRRFCGGEK